jgi:hypothetical protein
MKHLLIRMLVSQLSARELAEIGGEILPTALAQLARPERVPFLRDSAQRYLGGVLGGLERSERVELMNALLPLVAREFPLEQVNLLDAFPTPLRKDE